MVGQTAEITWRDGQIPVSKLFDDPYFSVEDGLAETRHVFLAGNDLPTRLRPGFHIAELGFGTGLNMLCAWKMWTDAGIEGVLEYTSFEAFPMAGSDIAKALAAFPSVAGLAGDLLPTWDSGAREFELPGIRVNVVVGDARETLPHWKHHTDAWFLDGFSPAKNPELWEPDLLAEVGRHTNPGGTLATYTAAGFVRRALADAGFSITRVPGYGSKRHMTVGKLESPE